MNQPVAATGHSYDVGIATVVVTQCLAQRRNVNVQVIFRDCASSPQSGHQFVLADHCSFCQCKQAKEVEGATAQFYKVVIVQQPMPSEIEPEAAEADFLGIIRKLYQISSSFRT